MDSPWATWTLGMQHCDIQLPMIQRTCTKKVKLLEKKWTVNTMIGPCIGDPTTTDVVSYIKAMNILSVLNVSARDVATALT